MCFNHIKSDKCSAGLPQLQYQSMINMIALCSVVNIALVALKCIMQQMALQIRPLQEVHCRIDLWGTSVYLRGVSVFIRVWCLIGHFRITLQFPRTTTWSRGFVPAFHTFAVFSRLKPRLQEIVRDNWKYWSVIRKSRRRVGRGGAMGANAPPPPPRAEKVRLEGCKDELTKKKEHQRWIFSSNLSTHAALHSVENLPEVVDHLKLCSWYRDQSTVAIR